MVRDAGECSVNTANATIVDCSDNSFTTGQAAITPSSGCTAAKIKASAIQENLHNFINWGDQDVRCYVSCGYSESQYNYEHALGEVKDFSDATPMLTYHPSLNGLGECSTGDVVSGHTTTLTCCTKNAVKTTADDPHCNINQTFSDCP